MAIENYSRCATRFATRRFNCAATLSFELERRFPDRFIPRYSMVMFHPEIPYAEAQRRGAVQAGILDELSASKTPSPPRISHELESSSRRCFDEDSALHCKRDGSPQARFPVKKPDLLALQQHIAGPC